MSGTVRDVAPKVTVATFVPARASVGGRKGSVIGVTSTTEIVSMLTPSGVVAEIADR